MPLPRHAYLDIPSAIFYNKYVFCWIGVVLSVLTVLNRSHDPFYNQAFEEYVFQAFPSDDVFLLWVNDPAVVVGSHQNICREVHVETLRRLGIPVVRRITGGGTVYHDRGNVNYTYITQSDGLDYDRCLGPVIAALNRMGIPAEKSKTCDLAIGGENYKRIKGTCKELAAAFAETEEPDPDGPHPIFTAQPFFTRIRYKKGVITATFNPFMQPYLLELKGCFTVYNLTEYLSLPSLYSQRIFEITKSLANSKDGEAIISMADLHRFLDSPKSFQANFKDFRRFVLEKAHKDITEKTSFRFEWEPVKVGRSVEKIRFIFSGGKKALAQKEQKKAKEEKRQRLTNQRFIRAVECAKAKGGDCRTMDNVRIVCKLCREKGICESLSSTRPHVVKQGSLLS